MSTDPNIPWFKNIDERIVTNEQWLQTDPPRITISVPKEAEEEIINRLKAHGGIIFINGEKINSNISNFNISLEPYEAVFKNLLEQLKKTGALLDQKAQSNNQYKAVASSLTTLCNTLNKEMQVFFAEPSALKFQHFHKVCKEAINVTAKEAVQHRGWHAIDPIIRGLLGILSALTLIPGLIVEVTSTHGFVKTFFTKPEVTTTLGKINEFKTQFEEQQKYMSEEINKLGK